MKKTLFIQHRAPYGSESAQETLDAALVCAAFGQDVSLLFQDDGVWQLLTSQSGKPLQRRTLGAQLEALELYDVKKLFVDAESLQARHIDVTQLTLSAQILDSAALKKLLAEQDMVLRL
jgi:tRNA 2-thiouridine synthesizing protein C